MKKLALVTGATSGIGRATALKLATDGYNLIVLGRRAEKLNELKKDIESKSDSKVLPLTCDIRVYTEVENTLIKNLSKEWSKIDVLVNAAGLGVFAPIHEGVCKDWDNMIDTNIKGLLYVTRAISPGMVERKSGHIVNIGSTAGSMTYRNLNVYCATKFAVDALSKCMKLDLHPYGIRVTQICPGRVETGFSLVSHNGDAGLAKKDYAEFTALKPEDIANAISYALSQPLYVSVEDILIVPTVQ